MSTAKKPKSKKKPFIERGTWKPGEKPSDFIKTKIRILSLEEIRANDAKKSSV
jgi:hypothetical protein